MATVTLPPESAAPLQTQASAPTVVRIEPPRGWLELRLAEVWEYRELLYFFAMRDIKIRYKQTAIAGASLSRFLLRRAGPLGIFFPGSYQLHQHRRGQPERDYESLFSALDFAGGRRAVRFGGFRDRIGRNGDFDAFLWDPSAGKRAASPHFDCLGDPHRPRSGAMDFGAERFVSRCARGNALCRAVLDAGVAGCVPQFAGARALAVVIRTQSHGRSDRRFPVGADRAWSAARRGDGRRRGWRLRGAARRPFLFPANGNQYRRPRLR